MNYLFQIFSVNFNQDEREEQHNCKATGYWAKNSVKCDFSLISHEYLFVFRKQQ